MFVWVCDLIVVLEDVFFVDLVVWMGILGVEYFVYVYELNLCIVKEFLFFGEWMLVECVY